MIEIRDLSLTYQGPKGPVHALRGIDLRIASGEVTALADRLPSAGLLVLASRLAGAHNATETLVWDHAAARD